MENVAEDVDCDEVDANFYNKLSRIDIVRLLKDMKTVDDPQAKQPGKSKVHRPSQRSFKFRVSSQGDMWLNPKSFSSTKTKKKNGYATMPLKAEIARTKNRKGRGKKKAASGDKTESGGKKGKKKKDKSEWFSRVLVHCAMWRLFNDFKQIPEGYEVSHLTNEFAVGPANLTVESPDRNKHRIGCHRLLDGEECKCGLPARDIPFCRNANPVGVRTEEFFFVEGQERFFRSDDDPRTARDEKALLKAVSSQEETQQEGIICQECFCVEREKLLDLETCSVRRLFKYCICHHPSLATD